MKYLILKEELQPDGEIKSTVFEEVGNIITAWNRITELKYCNKDNENVRFSIEKSGGNSKDNVMGFVDEYLNELQKFL